MELIILDLFGFWQTVPYVPPIAEQGRVPRNDFGNVELFQPGMLPRGCVHLKNMPNLNRLCRKLNIDCAAAVVGFDAHGGFSHAVYDGWVICEEFKETVVLAFEEEEKEQAVKLVAKRQEKIINNWASLVRHLLIRERMKFKEKNKISIMKKMKDSAITGVSDTHGITDLDCDVVGGKLNTLKANDQPENTANGNSKQEEPTTSTRETALIKIGSKKKAANTKPNAKNGKQPKKTSKRKSKDVDYEEESEEEDPEDPEFDFKSIKKTKRLSAKIKANTKLVEDSDSRDTVSSKSSKTTNSNNNLNKNKLDENGDLKLSESEDDLN